MGSIRNDTELTVSYLSLALYFHQEIIIKLLIDWTGGTINLLPVGAAISTDFCLNSCDCVFNYSWDKVNAYPGNILI